MHPKVIVFIMLNVLYISNISASRYSGANESMTLNLVPWQNLPSIIQYYPVEFVLQYYSNLTSKCIRYLAKNCIWYILVGITI